MDDVRLKAAKNLAAIKAFEVYTNTIKEQVGEEGLIAVLDGTEHVHTAILLVEDKPMGIFCDWFFSTNIELVKRLVASRTQRAGSAPS